MALQAFRGPSALLSRAYAHARSVPWRTAPRRAFGFLWTMARFAVGRGTRALESAAGMLPFAAELRIVYGSLGIGLAVWALTALSVPFAVVVIGIWLSVRLYKDPRGTLLWGVLALDGYCLSLWVLSGFNPGLPWAWTSLIQTWFANEPISLWIPIATSLAVVVWLGPTRSGAAFIRDHVDRKRITHFAFSPAVCVLSLLAIERIPWVTSFQWRAVGAVGILIAMSLVSRFSNFIKADTRKQAVAEARETADKPAVARVTSMLQPSAPRITEADHSGGAVVSLNLREGETIPFDLDAPDVDQVAFAGAVVEGERRLSAQSLTALARGQSLDDGARDHFPILRKVMNSVTEALGVAIPIRSPSQDVRPPATPASVAPAAAPADAPAPVPVAAERAAAETTVVQPAKPSTAVVPDPAPAVSPSPQAVAVAAPPVPVVHEPEASVPDDDGPSFRYAAPLEDPVEDVSDSVAFDQVEPILLDEDAPVFGTKRSTLGRDPDGWEDSSSGDEAREAEPAPVIAEVLRIEIGESDLMVGETLEDPAAAPSSPPLEQPAAVSHDDDEGPSFHQPAVPEGLSAAPAPMASAIPAEPVPAPAPASEPAQELRAVPAQVLATAVHGGPPALDHEQRRLRGVSIRMIAAYTNMVSKGVAREEIERLIFANITDAHLAVMETLAGGVELRDAYQRSKILETPVVADLSLDEDVPSEAPEPVPVPAAAAPEFPEVLPSSSEASGPAAPHLDVAQPEIAQSEADHPQDVSSVPHDESASIVEPDPGQSDPVCEQPDETPRPTAEVVAGLIESDDRFPPSVAPLPDKAPVSMSADLPMFDITDMVILSPELSPAAAEPAAPSPVGRQTEMPAEDREAIAAVEQWMVQSAMSVADLEAFFTRSGLSFPDEMEKAYLVRRLAEYEPSEASARRLEGSLATVLGRVAGQAYSASDLEVIKGLYATVPSELYDRWRFRSREQMLVRLGLFFQAAFTQRLVEKLDLWLQDTIKSVEDIALARSYLPAVEILLKGYVERAPELAQLNSAIDLAEFNLSQANTVPPSLVHEGIGSASGQDGAQARVYAHSRLVSATLPHAIQDSITHFLRLATVIDTIDMTVKRESLKSRSSIEAHPLFPSLTELEFRAAEIIEDMHVHLVKREQMLSQIPMVIRGRNEDAGVLYQRILGNTASISDAVMAQRDRQQRALGSLDRISALEADLLRMTGETEDLRAQMKERVVTDTVTALARALSDREPSLKFLDRRGPVKLRAEIGRDTEVAVVILHGGDQKWAVMSGTKLEVQGIRGAKVQSIDLVALRDLVRNSHQFGNVDHLRLRVVLEAGDLSGAHSDYVFSRRDIVENPVRLLDESDFDKIP